MANKANAIATLHERIAESMVDGAAPYAPIKAAVSNEFERRALADIVMHKSSQYRTALRDGELVIEAVN